MHSLLYLFYDGYFWPEETVERKRVDLAVDYEYSSYFLRDSRASETRARVKITPREKRREAEVREKNEGLQTKSKLLTLCLALTTQNSDWLSPPRLPFPTIEFQEVATDALLSVYRLNSSSRLYDCT